MKLLVLGASGLVGKHLLNEAKKRGYDVNGTYQSQNIGGLLQFESSNMERFREIIDQKKPEIVVDCCSWTWVDGCELEPKKAFKENAIQPGERARIALQEGIRYAYVSTSYVFRGDEETYGEDSKPHPINTYGASKLEGEYRIQNATNNSSLIVRTMGVFGREKKRKNFLYQVIDSLKMGKILQVPCDQFGNFTYAGDLAEGILMLIESDRYGIWNVAGPRPLEKRSDIARSIASYYGLDQNLIVEIQTRDLGQKAARPKYAGLTIKKMICKYKYSPKSIQEIMPLSL